MERVKIDLEFIFRASPTILYKFITTPSCLIRWFCDEVDIQDDPYTFSWSGSEEVANLIDDVEDDRVRFQWEDAESDKEFLEFRMRKSPVTNETILEITDYCDSDEVKDQEQLWKSQITQLKSATGGEATLLQHSEELSQCLKNEKPLILNLLQLIRLLLLAIIFLIFMV